MLPLGDVIPVRTRPYVTYASMAGVAIAGGSLLQIAANVIALWIFGRTVEDRMGHGRFVVFVAICAAVAGFAEALSQSMSLVAAGLANGGVAGLIAAYFVIYPQSKVAVLVPVGVSLRVIELPATVFLALWFLVQVATATGWAPLAAAVAGAAGVLLFRRPERQRVEWWNELQER